MVVAVCANLEGPLATHIGSFTKLLEDQGFSQESSHVQTRLVADFSRWLKQTHAVLPAITGQHISRYLRYRARHRRRRSSDTCVLKRLLDFLRRQGAIEELPIVSVEVKPYQQLLDKYTGGKPGIYRPDDQLLAFLNGL